MADHDTPASPQMPRSRSPRGCPARRAPWPGAPAARSRLPAPAPRLRSVSSSPRLPPSPRRSPAWRATRSPGRARSGAPARSTSLISCSSRRRMRTSRSPRPAPRWACPASPSSRTPRSSSGGSAAPRPSRTRTGRCAPRRSPPRPPTALPSSTDTASADLGVGTQIVPKVDESSVVRAATSEGGRAVTDSVQSTATTSGDYRSLALTRCGAPMTDATFLGISTATGDSSTSRAAQPDRAPRHRLGPGLDRGRTGRDGGPQPDRRRPGCRGAGSARVRRRRS